MMIKQKKNSKQNQIITITESEYSNLSEDQRGTITKNIVAFRGDIPREWIGKRTMLYPSSKGTSLLIEGISLSIVPDNIQSWNARSKTKDYHTAKLGEQTFPGIYELNDGSLIECHEWLEPEWDEEEKEPDGGVYYTIYNNGEEDDGGVLGYNKKDKFSHFEKWLAENGQGIITRKIADEGTEEYDELMDAMDSDEYNEVKSKFNLKNKKTNKMFRRTRA